MAITQIIATLPAVLNDSETFYEDIAIRNNSLVTVSFPSINTWATQANALAVEVNDKAAQVAAQAVDGGYSQDYINTNFVGVNNVQTIAGIKTFSSPIVATTLGSAHYGSGLIINGDGATNTIFPSIGFHQPGVFAGNIAMTSGDKFSFFQIDGITKAFVDADLIGNAATVTNGVYTTGNQIIAGIKTFSSSPIVPTPTTGTQAVNKDYVDTGAGAAFVANDNRVKTALNASGTAPIYACRAWVNFNGTGTVAIRASGNVSSIIDNGAGDYTVNFTTAMPDDNYSLIVSSKKNDVGGSGFFIEIYPASNALSTTSARVLARTNSLAPEDSLMINVAIFR